jgi:hypothetical protein
MNSMGEAVKRVFSQSSLLSTFVRDAQRPSQIPLRLGKKRRKSLWAPTRFQWDCHAFAKRQAIAAFWSCRQDISAGPFRQSSAGQRLGAAADLIDFAKVPSSVLQ